MTTRYLFVAAICLFFSSTWAQNTTPTVVTDKNAIPSSFDPGSPALYSGTASMSLPIFEIKCGSLSLPISIDYSYDGLKPIEDASWVGLGWNLNAGGQISRIIQGAVDSTKQFGRNYGQYSIHDSLVKSNNTAFFQNIYKDDKDTSFDSAPDIFDGNFNGYSTKFYWYNGKAYFLSFSKELNISWPSVLGAITIKTGDGTTYVFAQAEVVFARFSSNHTQKDYNAAFHLTSIVSADTKDTITFNYTTCAFKPFPSLYSNFYVQGTYDFGGLGITYGDTISPVVFVPVLQNIVCRNSRVSFFSDAAFRTDIPNNCPKLREIDVVDSITRKTIHKNLFSYEYFGQTTVSPTAIERLKLKQFSTVNPLNAADSMTYRFSYVNEYGSFPSKGSLATDYWGYYNNNDEGELFLNDGGRSPNFSYCSYGALDTVAHPTGGFTVYQYEQNDYDSSSLQTHAFGPGVRVRNISQFNPGYSVPATSNNYSYLADDGISSSGVLSHVQSVSSSIYIKDTVNFNRFVLSNNTSGNAIMDNIFFYSKVTENSAMGNEKHRADYYFRSFSNAISDIDLSKKTAYLYDSVLGQYKPLLLTVNNYDSTTDSSFLSINPYIDSSYAALGNPGILAFKYGYTYYYNPTYWRRLNNQRTVQYDTQGDSSATTVFYNYNSARNMDSSRESLTDGRALIRKFKYPDDYVSGITGNMVSKHVISPVIERQTWLQNSGSAPKMVSGSITSYDQSIFRPLAVYVLETSLPLTVLNNETLSAGLYSKLVSDTVAYILKDQLLYDGNSNMKQEMKVSDIGIAYIWDYRHSMPVAVAKNALANQIAYTSFECDNGGNWTMSDTAKYTLNSLTGNQSYNLTSGKTISASPPSGTSYVVSYWSTNGPVTVSSNGSPVSAKPAGPTKNGWTYFEHVLPSTTSAVSLTSSSSALIDELRLYPANAQMSTSTFNPLIGLSSNCDVGNRVNYYFYDGLSRLRVIKDQDGNIVKTIDYHYQGH
jgi:hypothetical protein